MWPFSSPGDVDIDLDAALRRVAALPWTYEPLPSESLLPAARRPGRHGEVQTHPMAARLLPEAHDVVHAIDRRAFPEWRYVTEWADVCEAAFLALVFVRLCLTGFRESVIATCNTLQGEGLDLPSMPLMGVVDAQQAADELWALAERSVRGGDPAATWIASVQAYGRLLCYAQHTRIELSDLERRVLALERRLEERSLGHTFGHRDTLE